MLMIWFELVVSYGVNMCWMMWLLVSWEGEYVDYFWLESWNWVNDVLLIQGEKFYDLVLYVQLICYCDESMVLEFGLVWQIDVGCFKFNVNVFWEYDNCRYDMWLKLQWCGVYCVVFGWCLGVEGFSEVGCWNDWLLCWCQFYCVGLVLLVMFWDEGVDIVMLNVVYFFGKIYGQWGNMFMMQLQWLC